MSSGKAEAIVVDDGVDDGDDGNDEADVAAARSVVDSQLALSAFASPRRKRRAPTASSSSSSSSSRPSKIRKLKQTKKKKKKYTPLEQQVVALLAEYHDCVLMVEVGYKYRFFGEHAEIASKVLGIMAMPAKNFLSASVPTYRLGHHLRRLVAAGYKVAVADQTDTHASKAASGSRSGSLYQRRVSGVYTRATIGASDFAEEKAEEESGLSLALRRGRPPKYIVALCESRCGHNFSRNEAVDNNAVRGGRVHVGFLAVDATAGLVFYDSFVDNFVRSEIETRLANMPPCELLLSRLPLSSLTERIIGFRYAAGKDEEDDGQPLSIVRRVDMSYAAALGTVAEMCPVGGCGDMGVGDDEEMKAPQEAPPQSMAQLLDLDPDVIRCVAAAWRHLQQFGLRSLMLRPSNYHRVGSAVTLNLPATTLHDLEVLSTQDGQRRGSLLWLLDQTRTPMGGRLLRRWVSRPLGRVADIEARLDAVAELADAPDPGLAKLLATLPDLDRALARIQHGKSQPAELLAVLQAFSSALASLPAPDQLSSAGLRELLGDEHRLPRARIASLLARHLASINGQAARENRMADLFSGPAMSKDVRAVKSRILAIDKEIEGHLRAMKKLFRQPRLAYKSMQSGRNLIEMPNNCVHLVPDNYTLVNATQRVKRYLAPEVEASLQQLDLATEELEVVALEAWATFLRRFDEAYPLLREVSSVIAQLDCLLSLAAVATRSGYVRPTFVGDGQQLIINGGRHPMVEAVLADTAATFVPNSIAMGCQAPWPRCVSVFGPNMGGKSTFGRSIALIALMAQVGSHVPAEAVEMSVFDSIHTRMGASDDILRGQSTFYSELSHAACILREATPRSLCLLDELGRGTSTHDGSAIAYAALDHLVSRVGCLTVFITHYPLIAQLANESPADAANFHMSYLEGDDGDVTFLYQLEKGESEQSYGINVARLAGVPAPIRSRASQMAKCLRQTLDERLSSASLVREVVATAAAAAATVEQPSRRARLLKLQDTARQLTRPQQQQKQQQT